jgi:DNA-binding transcriptional LysR family regulator
VDAGTADLALVHDADGLPAPLPSSLTQRHLHTDVGDVDMCRTHPLARLDSPLTAADLAGHAWVTSQPGTVCHQWFRRLFADVPEDPDVRHLVDDFATQLSLVASGNVIAMIPRLAHPWGKPSSPAPSCGNRRAQYRQHGDAAPTPAQQSKPSSQN